MLDYFTSGAIAMGFGIAAIFFLRFWRDTNDRLFALFGLAFILMSVNRIAIAVVEPQDRGEEQYWLRFLAFAFILVAILDKNRSRKPPT